MKCPNCGMYLRFEKNLCEQCGQDLRIYKKAFSASNAYYNDALERAKVRDLSGAVISLKKSLKLDKKNKNARNLLGLVYYEMGEVISALSEWVISKHFNDEENDAERYITVLQQNTAQLDVVNQTIRKYNSALISAKQGSDDLAVIQLKKVTATNPKFVRAQHLLALLYMKQGEYDLCRRCLVRAQSVDQNNTKTLYYLEELSRLQGGKASGSVDTRNPKERKHHEREEFRSFEPVTSYREDKPNVFVFINLILGLVIGVLVCFFLIKPTLEKKAATSYNQEINDSSQELADKQLQIDTLETDKESLVKENEALKAEVEKLQGVVHDETIYDGLFESIAYFFKGDKEKAAEKLLLVDEDSLEREAAKSMYETVKAETFESVSEDLYMQGNEIYNTGTDYDKALKLFLKALEYNPDNVDAIYFAGRCYHNLEKYTKAKKFYYRIIKDYPDSVRVSEAKSRLESLGITVE